MSDSKAVTNIGFITGIHKEAAILQKFSGIENSNIKCAGANSDRAYKLASDLAVGGCEVLISFGVAGALDPALNPGDLIVPDQVLETNHTPYETSTDQLKSHLRSRVDIRSGSLLGSNKLIASATEKLSQHQSTGAVAVDMESLAVAKAARDRGLPFLVIRAVSDTADQDLPSAVFHAIDDRGNPRIGAILSALAKKPHELTSLIKLAGNSNKAFETLRRVAAFGFDF
ncbi:MAG: hypothetical protein HN731_01420 [Rhodospirillaceae bacterium]|nr:hypothetical protein [Rhodospirillaceae bacterium]